MNIYGQNYQGSAKHPTR